MIINFKTATAVDMLEICKHLFKFTNMNKYCGYFKDDLPYLFKDDFKSIIIAAVSDLTEKDELNSFENFLTKIKLDNL